MYRGNRMFRELTFEEVEENYQAMEWVPDEKETMNVSNDEL